MILQHSYKAENALSTQTLLQQYRRRRQAEPQMAQITKVAQVTQITQVTQVAGITSTLDIY